MSYVMDYSIVRLCRIYSVALGLASLGFSSASAQDFIEVGRWDLAAEQAVAREITRPISARFDDLPLGDAIKALSRDSGVPIRIDEHALEDASITSDTPVTESFSNLPLRTALTLLLKRLDLTWQIRDDALLVTTPERVGNDMRIRIYKVKDLVMRSSREGTYYAFDALIELITTTIAPTTWDEVGGPGSIHEFRPGELLVVSQTTDVHDVIQEFLESLRLAIGDERRAETPRSETRRRAGRVYEPANESPRAVISRSQGWMTPRVHE